MARKSKTQIWIEYGAARLILGILEILPRRTAVRLGLAAARVAYRLLGRLRRVAERNLEMALPELDEQEQSRIIKGSFENLGRLLGEMSQFNKLPPERIDQMIDFEIDPEVFLQYEHAKTEGRGAIIATGHIGNWELFVLAYAALYEPISYLARPLDNPFLEDLTVGLRTRLGNRPINKTNAMIVASRVLREGGVLGILTDVNAHPKEGVFVPFFGVPACTSTGAALLALRTGSMIVPMCAVWDERRGRYRAIHGEVIEPVTTGDRSRDITDITARFTVEIEKMIRQHPEQWLWIHKRWKTRPPGEAGFYDL